MEPNWKDQTIWTGDNLDIMRGITSVRVLVEQIQLISRKCLNVIGDDVVK